MARVRLRIAVWRDLPALAALCRAAVGPHDYVLHYLPEMMAGREVFVSEAGGRIVAMMGVTECADRGLWIGQMRTHPDFRRQGFARVLLRTAYERAKRERRPALRLWASERNTASRALFTTSGFREVGAFTRVQADAQPGRAALRPSPDGRGVYARWRRSAFGRGGRGYASYHWHFLPLSQKTLAALAGRGELLAGARGAAVVWTEAGDPAAYASVLAGGREVLSALQTAAHGLGRNRVEVFLPRRRRILRWADEAGYAPAPWGTRAVLYERRMGR